MKHGIKVIVGCLSVWAIFGIIALTGNEDRCLEITSPRIATLVAIVILLLPAISLPWCVTALRSWVRIVLLVLVTPIALVSGYLAYCTAIWYSDELATDTNPDVRLLHSLKVDGPPIRAYEISPMLAGSWIEIRQERPLLPGLVWTTTLYSENKATSAVTLTVADRHHIRCVFLPSTGSDQQPHTVTLRTSGW